MSSLGQAETRPNPAPVHLDDALRDCESQASAALLLGDGIIGLLNSLGVAEGGVEALSWAALWQTTEGKCRTTTALPKTKAGRRMRCLLCLWLCLQRLRLDATSAVSCNAADTASKEKVSARTK
jgi:hypothetical protein